MNLPNGWIMVVCAGFLFAGCSEPSSTKKPGEPRAVRIPAVPVDVETPENIETGNGTAASFFVVDHYDPERDAVKDLEMATALASKSGKRILIEVGGKW